MAVRRDARVQGAHITIIPACTLLVSAPTFGISLASSHDMRKIAGWIIFLAIVSGIPQRAKSQGLSRVDHRKVKLAEGAADQFVERFRQTRDFGIVWKEFHMSDASCTYRANGFFSENDYERLKLPSASIEKLYIAFMNFYYLKMAHDLSLARIDSDCDVSEDTITPREIRVTEARSKYLHCDDDREPQNAGELDELIAELNGLSRLYRKHMPRNSMVSPAWRANYKYLSSRSDPDHTLVVNGDPTACIPDSVKVYIVNRGIFYFYLVEEHRRMRVAALGID